MKFAAVFSFMAASLPAAPVASWPFERIAPTDKVVGFHRFGGGIAGQALRSDGQTTHLIRPASQAPRLNGPFTIEAWLAIQTYP